MLDNMNFYKFLHKQILILIILDLTTGPGYIYIGLIHGTILLEMLWFITMFIVSLWGYKLYRNYADKNLNLNEKEQWLQRVKIFLYISFSLWTVIFLIYTSRSEVELHYIAIATQIGGSVVAATILASQKKLAIITIISMMTPLIIYFIVIDEFFTYLLSFFAVVLSLVLLHASRNTYENLVKSQYQAYHDYLTSLGNRRFFIELLEDTLKHEKHFTYLLIIDLDHFKTINDTLGHDVGDALLREVASRMIKVSNEYNNKVSRLGGDEFSILSNSYDTKEKCIEDGIHFAKTILELIKKRYLIDKHDLYMSASIGVSIINNKDISATQFIKEADIAMYEVKSSGRDGIVLFNEELSNRVKEKLEIERLLYFSLEHNEISLKFQPQIHHKTDTVSCEVLARWENKNLGPISPELFIPIAEQTGFIIELGYFILENALLTLKSWNEKGIELDQMSINISMRQMFHDSFIEDVEELLHRYLNDKLRSKIVFEITETSAAEDIQKLIKVMNILKEFGIRFSMDDFGTGYSSLSYLSQIPVSELKIDKSFISELSVTDGTIVRTILDVARNMNIKTVAEGVEKIAEKEFLIKNNCDTLQGYYYSKPLDKSDFEEYVLNSSYKV